MKTFKITLHIAIVSIIVTIFFYFSFSHKSFAQQCGGSPTCSVTLYSYDQYTVENINTGQTVATCYQDCQAYSPNLSTYPCQYQSAGGGPSICQAYLPKDMYCSTGGWQTFFGNCGADPCLKDTADGALGYNWSCYTSIAVGTDPNESGNGQYCAQGCTTYCTSGTANCGACGGGSEPTNTCGTTNGSQTCQHDQPQTCTNTSFQQACTYSYNNCSNNYACTGGNTCETNVIAHAYQDNNNSGSQGTGDQNLANAQMNDNGYIQTTDASGNATDPGKTSGTTVFIQMTAPNNGTTYKDSVITKSVTLNNNNGGTQLNFGFVPVYTISGRIFTDWNHDGSGTGDPNYTASTIQVTDGTHTVSTDASGNFSFTKDEINGTYTISIVNASVPSGYQITTPSQSITVNGADTNVGALGITPLYQISGVIYNDVDLSHCYNPSSHGCTYSSKSFGAGADTLFTQGSHLTITGVSSGTVSTTADAANGAYTTTQTLTSGTYTVTYDTSTTPLPAGYKFINPGAGNWTITVGDPAGSPQCSTGASPDASCTSPNNGNIANLDFGLTNESTWVQGGCGDIRNGGGYSQSIPATANCGGSSAPYAIIGSNICPNNAGILFSGSTNPNYGTGTGASASPNSVVGNSLFPETFTPRIPGTIATSWNFLHTTTKNVTGGAVDLASVCPSLTSCDLSHVSPGVYATSNGEGPVSFYTSDPSHTLAAGSYTFIINNDITFTSNVLIPAGSSASYTSSGDIHVSGSVDNAGEVGESDWTSLNPDLEGFFSADKNFDIDRVNSTAPTCNADGTPIDKKLNIQGSVITNAGGTGGTIVNSREGCLQDLVCPAGTIIINPTQLLHAPSPLKPPYTFWQELNP